MVIILHTGLENKKTDKPRGKTIKTVLTWSTSYRDNYLGDKYMRMVLFVCGDILQCSFPLLLIYSLIQFHTTAKRFHVTSGIN